VKIFPSLTLHASKCIALLYLLCICVYGKLNMESVSVVGKIKLNSEQFGIAAYIWERKAADGLC
jgi:hypothetical protein